MDKNNDQLVADGIVAYKAWLATLADGVIVDPYYAFIAGGRLLSARAAPGVPAGWKLVPLEPTPEVMAAASIAVWPTALPRDIEMARDAAKIVLMEMDITPGATVESIACHISTMAPAYRAMIVAAPEAPSDAGVPAPVASNEHEMIDCDVCVSGNKCWTAGRCIRSTAELTAPAAPTDRNEVLECPTCNGSGEQFGSFACDECEGLGKVIVAAPMGRDSALEEAAQLVESMTTNGAPLTTVMGAIGDAIRALKSSAAPQSVPLPADQSEAMRDAGRYRKVTAMTPQQLLLWRGAYGFSDSAIDDLDDIAAAAPLPAGPSELTDDLINLLNAIRPNYGDVGSRDVDVTAQRRRIDRAIVQLGMIVAHDGREHPTPRPTAAAPATPPAAPDVQNSTQQFWLDNRSKIIDAIQKEGFTLMSNQHGFFLMKLGTAEAYAAPTQTGESA